MSFYYSTVIFTDFLLTDCNTYMDDISNTLDYCFWTSPSYKKIMLFFTYPQPPSHMVILLTLWSSMNPLSSHLKGKHGPLQLQSPKLIAHEIKYMYTSNILTLLRLSNLLSLWLYHYQSDLLRSSFPAYPAGILWYIIKASFDNTLYFSLPLSFIWLRERLSHRRRISRVKWVLWIRCL